MRAAVISVDGNEIQEAGWHLQEGCVGGKRAGDSTWEEERCNLQMDTGHAVDSTSARPCTGLRVLTRTLQTCRS